MTDPLLEVRELHVAYRGGGLLSFNRAGVHAVDGVSFDIAPGETFGLVGESGSGKSTTGRAILLLTDIASGVIRFDGRDITALDRRARLRYRTQVQVVFQDPWSSLNPRRRVGEILYEPLRRHGIAASRAAHRAAVQELLDQVGLASYFASRYPRELSGGQRQRVGIARALALHPRLIVCDEPVSSLDVSTRAQIINLLLDVQGRLGLSYLFIAHDLSVVHHMSHRIGVMSAGKLVEVGDADSVYRNPRHPVTKALLEAEPVPDPGLQRARRARRMAVMTGNSAPGLAEF